MERKYFFFDIDGTLTDKETRKPVPSALDTLHALEKNGHFVAIATGRAHYKARPFMEEAGVHNMVCCGGGALVLDDKLLYNTPLDLEKAKQVVRQASELGYGVLLQLDDSIRCYAKDDRFREQVGERKEPTEYVIDPDLDLDKLDQILKVYVSIPRSEEDRLTSKDLLGSLRFVEEYLMFQYDEKHQGILDMLEKIGGKAEDVVVFGDDDNDLVMFDPQWTSIAMGNGKDSLKEKADYIAEKNVDNGIQKACLHFGWVKPEDFVS